MNQNKGNDIKEAIEILNKQNRDHFRHEAHKKRKKEK